MFVSSSTGSVQESLYNHFKEAIPIKPSAEFLQKIAVSITFTLLIRTTQVDLGKGAPINPAFLDVMFIRTNQQSIFLLSLTLLIWGKVLH